MPTSPLSHGTTLLNFTIYSDGNSISDILEIDSIIIDLGKDFQESAVITMLIRNSGARDFEAVPEFSLDRQIDIALGYHQKETKVFSGKVTENKIVTAPGSQPRMQITCKRNQDSGAIPKSFSPHTELSLTYGEDIIESELFIDNSLPKRIQGQLKFQGSAKARVGDTVVLNSFKKVFPKHKPNEVVINHVLHEVQAGNWLTTITV